MERTVRTQRSLSKSEDYSGEQDAKNNDSSNSEASSGKSYSEDPQPHTNNNNTLHRSRSQNKVKLLVRSQAVREGTSPPPDPYPEGSDTCSPTSAAPPPRERRSPQPPPSQQQPTSNRRHKLRREGSSQENWDHPPPLSRGNSREQYDSGNQVDLHQFIVETLNRNYKDRMLLLKIENDLIGLAKDPKRTVHKFAQMSSYQRMLVHRVAAYFGMEHNVDTTGASVIVNTTKMTRIPDSRFADFVRDDLLLPEEPRRSILKRDSSSFDETGSFKSGDRMLGGDSRRSKSFEEREEEYEKARRRIFNREHSRSDIDDCMDELQWENDEGVCSQCEHPNGRNPRLLKVGSYECSDTHHRGDSLRLSVAKSHSFNGYEPQTQTRILTKQDSGSSMSSRISPSSSGYKSQRSDATLSATPSPTATPNPHIQLSGQSGGALSPEPETVVWAVTDLASVPPGSMLIHPQSGQPYTNSDGTIYHYDPTNPPRVAVAEPGPPMQSMPHGPKHDMLEGNHLMNGNLVSSSGPIPHELGKQGMMLDNGYDSGGSYSAPPPSSAQCQQPAMQAHPPPLPHYGGAPQQLAAHGGLEGPQNSAHYSNPVVYPVHHSGPPLSYPMQYDPRLQDGNGNGGDLSNYMMGLSLDSSRPPDTRQIMYWPSHHLQSHASVPVYYNGSGGGPNGVPSRYPLPPIASQTCPTSSHSTFIPAPPPLQAPAPPLPQPALAPAPAPPQASHISPDHSGCYSSTYNGAQDCIPYAPSVHMYYTHPYSSGGNGNMSNGGAVANGGNGYFGNNVPTAPLVAVQYQQPCPHPTTSHTPQGVCGQFTVYNGCYPGHYAAQPNSSLPVPPMFRKPLSVGARCVSPMRPPYSVSPTVKERPTEEKMPPIPVYGFRVLPGEMRLLNNQGRLPFTIHPSKGPHPRKHRGKISSQGRPQQSLDVPVIHAASKA